jgi:DNA-binding NtrC family response regulator
MPEMDGRQCLGEILRIDPTVKVIIASGYSESGSASGATVDGAQGFVQKPYNMRQLLTAVREILDNDLLGAVNTADGA